MELVWDGPGGLRLDALSLSEMMLGFLGGRPVRGSDAKEEGRG